jgi:hypothetical protein
MTELPAKRNEVRIGDADRDQVAGVLREALAQGRIDAGELEERLSRAYAARTFGDLEPLTSDLPDEAAAVPVPGGFQVGRTPRFKFSLAIMGGSSRGGNWVVPRRYLAFAIMGGVKIDLRDAAFAERGTDIHAIAIMGGVTIIVPEGLPVEVSGLGIMGGVDHSVSGPGVPGAPLVRVSGLALMGGIGAQRRRRRRSRDDGGGSGVPGPDDGTVA